MSEQQLPKSITARFSINLEDPKDILSVSRVSIDGKEAKAPVFLVIGGLPLAENLENPAVRASYAEILLKMSQQLALGLLREAQESLKPQEGVGEPPAPSPLAAE